MNLIEELLKENKSFSKDSKKKKVVKEDLSVGEYETIYNSKYNSYDAKVNNKGKIVVAIYGPIGYEGLLGTYSNLTKDGFKKSLTKKYIKDADNSRSKFEDSRWKQDVVDELNSLSRSILGKTESKKKVVKESDDVAEIDQQFDLSIKSAKRRADKYIIEHNLERKGYYAVCYAVRERYNMLCTGDSFDGFTYRPVFIAYSPDHYSEEVRRYITKNGLEDVSDSVKFYSIYND